MGEVVIRNFYTLIFFFFKQKTAYEMCGRDWSSDVCSSDLGPAGAARREIISGGDDWEITSQRTRPISNIPQRRHTIR